MNEEGPLCSLCGMTENVHSHLNHEFNLDGRLVQKAPPKPEPTPISSLDIPLRMALLQKGVITGEDLAIQEALLRQQLARHGNGH